MLALHTCRPKRATGYMSILFYRTLTVLSEHRFCCTQSHRHALHLQVWMRGTLILRCYGPAHPEIRGEGWRLSRRRAFSVRSFKNTSCRETRRREVMRKAGYIRGLLWRRSIIRMKTLYCSDVTRCCTTVAQRANTTVINPLRKSSYNIRPLQHC